jgi:hypothetical protein
LPGEFLWMTAVGAYRGDVTVTGLTGTPRNLAERQLHLPIDDD